MLRDSPDDGSHSSYLVTVAKGGRPTFAGEIGIAASAAARFRDRTYLFDARGMNRLAAQPPGEYAIDEFQSLPEEVSVASAASGKRRLLAVGFDSAGIPNCLEFDGAALQATELTRPRAFTALGGEQGPARICIAATGDDTFAYLLADGARIFLGVSRGAPTSLGLLWSEPFDVAGATGPIALDATAGSVRAMVGLRGTDGVPAVAILDCRLDDPAPRIETARTKRFALGEDWLGTLPPSVRVDGVASLLLADATRGSNGAARLVTAGDDDDSVPLFLAPWNLRESRFELPLLIHFGMFMVLSLLLRRREETVARVVMFRPAPLLRRLLAFLIDLALVAFVAGKFCDFVFGGPELEFLASLTAEEVRLDHPVAIPAMVECGHVALFLFTLIAAFSEAATGKTLGKRICGLEVIALSGDRPSLATTLTRAVMIFADLWIQAPIGVVCILLTKRRQRLGDIFGGAVVVESKSLRVRPATEAEAKLLES